MGKYKNSYKVFETVKSFLIACERDTPSARKAKRAKEWYGNLSWRQALKLTKQGDTSAVAEANKILDQVDASVSGQSLRPCWQNAVAGPVPNVPAYLANAPETMLNMQQRRGPKRQVNIYYCPVVSGGMSAETIFRRGVAVLALAMQLSRVVDVNLYFFTTYDHGNHVVKLARPMVLSEAAHILTNTGFLRHLSYSYARYHGFYGSWAGWYNYGGNVETNIKCIRKRLNLTNDDIVIPPMDLEQWSRGELADPVKYINKMLAKYK